MSGEYPYNASAEVVGQDASGAQWSSHQPNEGFYYEGMGAFSRDGRYCCTVFERGVHAYEDPEQDTYEVVLPALVARSFDMQERCWLRERVILDLEHDYFGLKQMYSQQIGPLAAAVEGARGHDERVLLVFGILEPWLQVMPLASVTSFHWLGNGALALLSMPDDGISWKLELIPLPGSTAAPGHIWRRAVAYLR